MSPAHADPRPVDPRPVDPRPFGGGAHARVVRAMKLVSLFSATAAVIVPALVLIGWATGQPTLTRVLPGLVAMNPVTAVCFGLCGASLWLVLSRRAAHAALPLCAAVVTAAIGKLIELLVLKREAWGIDRLLFARRVEAEPIPNHIAPNTALGLALAGAALALLASATRRPRRHGAVMAAQVMAIAVASLGLLALVGYAYRSHSLYGIGTFTPMALHTAVLFLLLSLGTLFARPDVGVMTVVSGDQPAGALARRMLPLAILAPALVGAVRLWGMGRDLWSAEFGFTLVVITLTVAFTSLLWWELALLRGADLRRAAAERAAADAYTRLAEVAESERRAHDTLKHTHAQLVQAEKMAGLGQMVAGVAHEINNPLAFVTNNLAVLQRDTRALCDLLAAYAANDPARAAELAEQIEVAYVTANLPDVLARSREGLKRISQIVTDLRDFARLDEAEVQDADLNAGVRSTANIVEGHARKKGVTITLHLADLPAVRCHSAKVNQVVMNLLTNAIDASPPGGAITVATTTTTTTATAEACVRISVTDQGPGVPPHLRDKIFDPFFTTKPPGQGTGLGLSISYGIVKDHAGDITVDDATPQGARFTVRLPLRPKST